VKTYILSCVQGGGVYTFDLTVGGELTMLDKQTLNKPMYAAIDNGVMHVVMRETFPESDGYTRFDLTNGKPQNPSVPTPTHGTAACHVSADGSDIYCVNYLSGSVVKLPDKVVCHSGSSVHPRRQTSPHPHQVVFSPDKRFLLVTDLGCDRIEVYDRGLRRVSSVAMPSGHGPRHAVFSNCGNYLYCANEIASTISVLRYDSGTLTLLFTRETLQEKVENSTVAAIRLSGGFLYVSNRGDDSISRFKVDGDSLSLMSVTKCGVQSPRDFNITPDGQYLVCAGEKSDNVNVFRLDGSDGSPIDTGVSKNIPAPLCVLFE